VQMHLLLCSNLWLCIPQEFLKCPFNTVGHADLS
jgi:hypothetical protein